MHNLLVPVPPMLEAAVGYSGTARFVAFYWMPAGDEAMYDDGRISADGHWDAYLAFVQHSSVWPELRPYNLGNSDQEAEHWLLLDRQERVLSVAPEQAARRVLRQQWPAIITEHEQALTDEEWQRIVSEAMQKAWAQTTQTYSMEDAQRMLTERQQKVDELVRWLDQQERRH